MHSKITVENIFKFVLQTAAGLNIKILFYEWQNIYCNHTKLIKIG